MVIVNGIIHPVDGPVVPQGFVAWAGERITAVGPMERLPQGDLGEVLDARGGHVTPGYLDAHCHLGLFPDSWSYDGVICGAAEPVAPDFDPLAHADLTDRCFAEARAAGVTTVAIAPGSKNPVAGRVACVKTDGQVVRPFAALKLALGETPERTTGLDRPDLARLLEKALSGLEVSRPVHVHAHRADDIATALGLGRKFGLKLVIVHGTEGPLIADTIAAAGCPVITGPCLTDRSKAELKRLGADIPAKLARSGVAVAICTDHPETPIQYLPLCAALAVRGGMTEEAALAAITLIPARLLGLEDRLGSLTPGKEADIVLTPGHPFDPMTQPSAVILGGKQVV